MPRIPAIVALVSCLLGVSPALSQDPELEPLNRFPRMMQEYYVGRVRSLAERREQRWEQLQTRQDAEQYIAEVKEKIAASFGPFPERTPLRPRITGVLQRDGYRVEKILLETRPNFHLSGNLYLPQRPGRLPAVVGTCGHSSNGKAAEAYQSFAQGLVRRGYVVFLFDPIGQGERLQYPDDQLQSTVGVGVREHLYAGNQQSLVGEFLGAWRAWDGIRALDYLLSREEVDPQRVGVTGNSGGGTMTTWLCGVEPRWTMAAPACFVTRFQRNLENELPADTEQCPPRALALGLEHEDFLAVMAPKPVIILAKERDYFDVRGSEAAFAQLRKLYALLGQPDQIGLAVGPTTHGYSQENREAMYGWFHRFAGVDAPAAEPALTLEKDEDLWCAPEGQVARLNSRTVPEFTAEKAEMLRGRRGQVRGEALRAAIRRTLRVDAPAETPYVRILRARGGRRFPAPHFTTYAVETEPGVQAIVYLLGQQRHDSRPPRDGDEAVLYVSHQSSDAELRQDPRLREFIEQHPQAAVYAMDVRGIGESRPNTCGPNSFLEPYGSDYFYAVHGLMLDDPIPGQRTRDVRRVLQWLAADGRRRVHLVGRGWGSLPAALAALDAPQVASLTLWDALDSYDRLAREETAGWPLATLIPDVLSHFDLPDVYAELSESLPLARVLLER